MPGTVASPHAVAPWPYQHLDVAAATADGWRPTPFRDVVLKVHQRCNLACDYCYVYEMADQSWRHRPAAMPAEVARAAIRRVAEHATAHQLTRVRLILHGGEPLLAGVDALVSLVADARAALPAGCRLVVSMQTNGLLLTEPTLVALHTAGITVGVSVDGSARDNDRRRRHADGRGSHRAVDRALRLLNTAAHRGAFAGLLCTVNPATDPVATYESLLAYAPPEIDFLLPHANWTRPPARRAAAGVEYADWLVAAFDRWYGAPRQETRVRVFEDLISLVLGGSSGSEQVGLSPVAVVVIDSDGAIEQVDSLKSAYEGAAATGLNVHTDALDAALRHPGVVARQLGRQALADACLACPVHTACGGGHYVHRYAAGTGFRNPSVYCADLRRLVDHVRSRVAADLSARLTEARRAS
ncbi:MAG TPA: FxsB family cyclophane-forming radical SAM/SPASM peptide maturase [Pilimelia sp.]|nr:FxsB family cyclophane-forming radical SAM/SPASM peptide maturase [Pilimelia sp.]